jgi:hypothetical protein
MKTLLFSPFSLVADDALPGGDLYFVSERPLLKVVSRIYRT